MADLPTPCLVLDADTLDANIATALALANAAGVGLRPHAKTHKSPEIARRLVAAGALGACVATIAEAEALSAAGIAGVLITAPLVTPEQIGRLDRLLATGAEPMLAVDHPDALPALAALGRPLRLLVDVDVGQGRTGVLTPEAAVDLAGAIAAAPGLTFAGVQAYWGQLQQRMPWTARKTAVEEQATYLRGVLDALEARGLPAGIVSGGGTGTFGIDRHLHLFTELQAGSFLFLDSLYGPLAIEPDGSNPFRHALFVRAAVVSANSRGNAQPKVVINAGLKAFATDSGLPVVVAGAPADAVYRYLGDEHGALMLPEGSAVALGTEVELIPSHCDPTVNLYPAYAIRRDGEFAETWPIAGRYVTPS